MPLTPAEHEERLRLQRRLTPDETAEQTALRQRLQPAAPASPIPSGGGAPLEPRGAQAVQASGQEQGELPSWLGPVATFGAGALSSLPGFPADLINLGLRAWHELPEWAFPTPGAAPQATPQVPFGSSDIEKRLGLPQPQNAVERVTHAAGGGFSPTVVLRALKGLGLAPEVLAGLTRWLSAGAKADVAMGTASGVGAEYGGTPGAIAAPLALAAGHRLASPAVQWAGRGIRAEQDISQAAQDAQQAEAALQAERQRSAQTVSQAKAQSAFEERGTAEGVERSRDALARASQGQRQTFTPLEPTLTQEVGPTFPSTRHAGAEAQQSAQAQAQALSKNVEQGVDQLRTQIGPKLDRLKMLEDTAHGVKTQFTESKKIIGPLFDATERITGNDGVILLDNLHGRTGPMLEEASQTGQGVPRG